MSLEKVLKRRWRKSLLANTCNTHPVNITYAVKQWSELQERLQIKYYNWIKQLWWGEGIKNYQELFSNTEEWVKKN